MSGNRARSEAADRRFSAAVAAGTRASQTSNFGAETPYLSLGNVTRAECAGAARMLRKLAGLAGVSAEEEQEILEMVGVQEFVR